MRMVDSDWLLLSLSVLSRRSFCSTAYSRSLRDNEADGPVVDGQFSREGAPEVAVRLNKGLGVADDADMAAVQEMHIPHAEMDTETDGEHLVDEADAVVR